MNKDDVDKMSQADKNMIAMRGAVKLVQSALTHAPPELQEQARHGVAFLTLMAVQSALAGIDPTGPVLRDKFGVFRLIEPELEQSLGRKPRRLNVIDGDKEKE